MNINTYSFIKFLMKPSNYNIGFTRTTRILNTLHED